MSTRTGTSGAHAPSAHAQSVAALGRRIHDLRSERGFSLQEFAVLSGLTAPVLSALERGDESVPVAALFAAASGLALPVSALFADAGGAASPAVAATVHAPAAPRRPAPVEAAEPPAGYRPLEMPDLWEPPAGTPYDEPAFAQPSIAAPEPVATPVYAQPATAYVQAAAPVYVHAVAPAATPGGGAQHPPAQATPRTFADLRVGVLAERTFATLPEFAVAAVIEAGYSVAVVASIFRVPAWRLEGWIRDGVVTQPQPKPFRKTR